jgi:hypothetical protein
MANRQESNLKEDDKQPQMNARVYDSAVSKEVRSLVANAKNCGNLQQAD